MKRIAIVGAGPIGVEAALAALERGFEAEIFERGEIADAVRQWGHVRMFSPFAMNATARGLARLRAGARESPPEPNELLTGAEFRERYLLPLARSLPGEMLHEQTAVLAISRRGTLKGDQIGDRARGEAPFRLLVRQGNRERLVAAGCVLDCSGTFGQPNELGDGGIPAPGERAAAARIFYGIPNRADAELFAGRGVLVVGAGHSAATAVIELSHLRETKIHWLLRRGRALPIEEIPNDPLPERARLATLANQLVRERRVQLIRNATVEEIRGPNESLEVVIHSPEGARNLPVDQIIGATGFRPDLSIARELQLQTCWATEGTYPLAAALLGAAGADCLTTPVFGAAALRHPEPGFFTLGMKSYGRAPNFLLRTGHEQIAQVLDALGKNSPNDD